MPDEQAEAAASTAGYERAVEQRSRRFATTVARRPGSCCGLRSKASTRSKTTTLIMFLPEELRPLTRGLAEETVIGRRPVTKPLAWEDAEEPS